MRRPSEEAESILVVLTKLDTCLDSINNCFGGVYNGIAGLQKDVVDLSKELLKSLRFEGERIQLLMKITELETKLKIMESDKKNTYTEYRRAAH